MHSGLVKELLLNGNVKQASKLLGRFYGIRGEIVKGQGLGKENFMQQLIFKMMDSCFRKMECMRGIFN